MPTVAELDIKVGAQVDGLQQGVDKVQRKMDGMKNHISSVGSSIAASFVAMFSIGAVSSFANKIIDSTEKLEEMAVVIGASSRGLQQLYYSAALTGKGVDQVDASLKKMIVNLEKIDDDGSKVSDALNGIGVNAQTLAGLSADQQFIEISKAMDRTADAGKRAAASIALFGKSGVGMYRIVGEDFDKIKEGLDGVTPSEAQISRINKFGDSLDAAYKKAEMAAMRALSATLEFAQAFKEGYNGVIPDQGTLDKAALKSGDEKAKAMMDARAQKLEEMRVKEEDRLKESDKKQDKIGESIEKALNRAVEDDIQRITDLVKTPMDIFAEKTAELADYFDSGAISIETAHKAYNAYMEDFANSDEKMKDAKKIQEDGKTAQDAYFEKMTKVNDALKDGNITAEEAAKATAKYQKELQDNDPAIKAMQAEVERNKAAQDKLDQAERDAFESMRMKPGRAFGAEQDMGAALAVARFGGADNAIAIAREQAKKLGDILNELRVANMRAQQQGAFAQ